MRYGSYANEDGQPEQKWHATVQNDNAIESQRLALRHARAMAAVLRAAKALRRARRSDVNRVGPVAWGAAYCKATEAHDNAVDRLVAVENEVKRGQ